jgi:uncharacterized protein (DUF1499 family)
MPKAGLILLALAAVAFLMREHLWTVLGGPADQGRIDFARLVTPETSNHYLVCPIALCTQARPDEEPPVFALSAAALRQALHQALAAESNLTLIPEDELAERYVARTPIMRFPDTVAVRFIPLSDRTSTLALYSRSLIGRGDLGTNRKRMKRWLEVLVNRHSGS